MKNSQSVSVLTKNEILDSIKKHLNLKRNKELADFLGITPQVVSNWYGRNTFDIELLYTKCVFLNPEWLLTGSGPMLKVNKEVYSKSQPVASVADAVQAYDPIRDNAASIQVIDVSASAGAGFFNADHPEVLGELNWPLSLMHRRNAVYYAGRVHGDSMFPTLRNNDYIIFTALESRYEDMKDGIYFIVLRTGEAFVKRVVNRLASEGFIRCTSDNTGGNIYRDFDVQAGDIARIYTIEWRTSSDMSAAADVECTHLRDEIDRLKMLIKDKDNQINHMRDVISNSSKTIDHKSKIIDSFLSGEIIHSDAV